MALENNENLYSPVFATLKTISLQNREKTFTFKISQMNEECQYERLELTESVQTLFPEGVLIVRDTKDIATFIKNKKIEIIRFDYINGSYSDYDITSVSYLNNAASESEENFVGIYFSNKYYKNIQTTTLLDYLPTKPTVYKIDEFVKKVATTVLGDFLTDDDYEVALTNIDKNIDKTTNYVLYKPLNSAENRLEQPADNAIQYLAYLSTLACGNTSSMDPRFLFWTNWNNEVNFKYFNSNIDNDPLASSEELTSKFLRFAVSHVDSPLVKLQKTTTTADGENQQKEFEYRKIYTLTTDPIDQFISKNYYYIRKVPKFLDNTPPSINNNAEKFYKYTTDALTFIYQDEGQKFNIEIIGNTGGATGPGGGTFSGFTAGADELLCKAHWGYYNQLFQPNGRSNLTFLGENFGTEKTYSNILMSGYTGYMPFVDNAQMWKNMFDMTEIHPHYPVFDNLSFKNLEDIQLQTKDTYLQQILDIRYKLFENYIKNFDDINKKENERLELMRKIEKQNFIMYVLCCMAKQEESFFALLTEYERDNAYNVAGNEKIPYRYNWTKLNFASPYGLTGPTGPYGGISGPTYWMHHIERWSKDPLVKGNTTQDDSWAINLNEHGLSSGYLPPGWVKTPPLGFDWRPIGVSDASFENKGTIHHIVKMNAVPMTDLLIDSKQPVLENYLGKYLYYFTATNVVDGTC